MKCEKKLQPDENEENCKGFFETDKEDVTVDIEQSTWEQLEIMAKEANMSPEDFASKLIVQRLRKVLGI